MGSIWLEYPLKGDLEAALPSYQNAVKTYEEMGNRLAISDVIGATGYMERVEAQINDLA